MAIIFGTSGNDDKTGTDNNDLIITGSGDDKIKTGEGNDLVFAGSGDDIVESTAGNDIVLLGRGDDTVVTSLETALAESVDPGCLKGDIYLGGSGQDTITIDLTNVNNAADYKNAFNYAFEQYLTAGKLIGFDLGASVKEYFVDNGIDLSADFHMYIRNFEFINFAGEQQNTAPTVDPAIFSVNENSPNSTAVGQVVATDLEDNIVSYEITNGNESGAFAIDNGGLITVADGSQLDFEGGTEQYILTVEAKDSTDLTGSNNITININDVNEAPVANAGFDQSVTELTLVTLDGSFSTDPDNNISSYFWEQTSGTPVTLSDSNSPYPTFTAPDINNPTEDLIFELTVTDTGGLNSTDSVTISVNNVNEAPVANADSYTTTEDTTLTIPALGVLDNDTDGDGDTLNAILENQPTNGSVILNSDGSFEYTPDPEFTGEDSFTYYANDGSANSDLPATVSITVNPSTPPTSLAYHDSVITKVDKSITINVLENDSVPPFESVSIATAPNHGTANTNLNNTQIIYDPEPGFSGTDTFSYTALGGGESDTASVTVYVVDNVIEGSGNKEKLFGTDDVDAIAGQGGNDELTGNASSDIFVFRGSEINPGEMDTIKDFEFGSGGDVILLESVFENLAPPDNGDSYTASELEGYIKVVEGPEAKTASIIIDSNGSPDTDGTVNTIVLEKAITDTVTLETLLSNNQIDIVK